MQVLDHSLLDAARNAREFLAKHVACHVLHPINWDIRGLHLPFLFGIRGIILSRVSIDTHSLEKYYNFAAYQFEQKLEPNGYGPCQLTSHGETNNKLKCTDLQILKNMSSTVFVWCEVWTPRRQSIIIPSSSVCTLRAGIANRFTPTVRYNGNSFSKRDGLWFGGMPLLKINITNKKGEGQI